MAQDSHYSTARTPFRKRFAHSAFCIPHSALAAIFLLFAGCDRAPSVTKPYEIVHAYPHDPAAFTQGLLYLDGVLYESTGLYGQSSVPSLYFAEGLAGLNGRLYQLTWREKTAFVYDLKTFQQEKQFFYPFEGWGLTADGRSLILSDGSD